MKIKLHGVWYRVIEQLRKGQVQHFVIANGKARRIDLFKCFCPHLISSNRTR